MGCPLCGHQSVRETKLVRPGKAVRIKLECAGCERLLGYSNLTSDPPKNSEEKINQSPSRQGDDCLPWVPAPPPDAWLYTSRRLDLEWLPNVPIWSAATLSLGRATASESANGDGPIIFYRLSPQVLVWLEHAGAALEHLVVTGGSNAPARDQVDAYCEAMNQVYQFAAAHLSPAEVRAAREVATRQAPALPEHEGPRIVGADDRNKEQERTGRQGRTGDKSGTRGTRRKAA